MQQKYYKQKYTANADRVNNWISQQNTLQQHAQHWQKKRA
jgi:hypothetical protein